MKARPGKRTRITDGIADRLGVARREREREREKKREEQKDIERRVQAGRGRGCV